MSRRCVVAGATGFVGQRVIPTLAAAGLEVIGGTRRPQDAARRYPGQQWTHLDIDQPATIAASLQGADTLVYLVHQMKDDHGALMERECRSAERVLQLAEQAGVRRIVYLGAPEPEHTPSEHLAARAATGRILRSGKISTIELQAGMIIGAGSQSWTIVRDLALRLPFMVLPRWLARASQPIGVDDVVLAIKTSVESDIEGSVCHPLPGPEIITAKQILTRVSASVGIRPVMVPIPILSPSLSSHWIRLVTRADYVIARQLVDGLTQDLVHHGENFWTAHPDLSRTPLNLAIERALAEESASAMPTWQHHWESLVSRIAVRA